MIFYDIILAVSSLTPLVIGLILFFFGWLLAGQRPLFYGLLGAALIIALIGQIAIGFAPRLPEISLFVWSPLADFRVNLGFRADKLSFFFGLPLAILTLLLVIYAGLRRPATEDEEGILPGRLYGPLLMAEGAGLAAFYSADLVFLYIWVEIVAVCLYLLSGPGVRGASSEPSSYQAFSINVLAGFVIFAPLLVLISRNGGNSFYPTIAATSVDNVLFVLVLVGALAKAAQFPFHVGFGNLARLPAPAYALITAGLVFPLALYLPARLQTIAGNNLTFWASASAWLLPIGALTVVTCGILAIGERAPTLSQKVALVVAGQFGFVVMALGLGQNFLAALNQLFALTFFAPLLFLVADQMQIEISPPPDPEKKGNPLPILRPAYYRAGLIVLYLLGALGAVGLPLSPAYVARWQVLNGLLAPENRLYFGLAMLGIGLTVAALAQGLALFLGETRQTLDSPIGTGYWPLLTPVMLAVIQTGLGFYPALAGNWLALFVQQVTPEAPPRYASGLFGPGGWLGLFFVVGLVALIGLLISRQKAKMMPVYNGGLLYGSEAQERRKFIESQRHELSVTEETLEGFEDEFFKLGTKVSAPPPPSAVPRLSSADYFSSLSNLLSGVSKVANTGYGGAFYSRILMRVLRFFTWLFEWMTERFYAALAALIVLVFIILLTR